MHNKFILHISFHFECNVWLEGFISRDKKGHLYDRAPEQLYHTFSQAKTLTPAGQLIIKC